MLIDGLELLESSSIINLVVPNGANFPVGPLAPPNAGELFYLTVAAQNFPIGLYFYDGTTWQLVVSNSAMNAVIGSATSITVAASFPTSPAPVDGQLCYKTDNVDTLGEKGLYVYHLANMTWEFVANSETLTALDTLIYTTLANEIPWLQASYATGTTSTQIGYLSTSYQDIQTQLDSKVSKAGSTMTGSLVFPTGTHIQLDDLPTVDSSAVNKAYVDSLVSGLTWKNAVQAATTANITLSGEQSIDGITVVTGDRVLVKSQTLPAENGIYIVDANAWSLATDFNAINEQNGAAVWVEKGTAYANTGWTVTSTIVNLGTDPIVFTQFNGASGITAGIGLVKSGNTLSVQLGAGIVELPTDEVGLDLYSTGGLFLTENGSAASTTNAAQLAIQLDGITLARSASGIKINQVTEHEILTSALGTGLTGGGGTVISLTDVVTAGSYNNVTVNAQGRVTAGSNVAYITGNESITLSGDISGTGTTSISTTLATIAGLTAGTYNNSATHLTPFNIDVKGRITQTATPILITPAFSSITNTPTTLAGYGITDAQPLNSDLTAILNIPTASGWLKKTGPSTWGLYSPSTLAGWGITDAQPLNANLSSISSVSTSVSGFLKLNNGVASVDTSTYLTSHPATSPSVATTVSNTGLNYIQSIAFDGFGHATSATTATIQSASTTQEGVVQLSDATNSTSTVLAATANAVRTAYNLADAALPKAGGTLTGDLTLNADPTQALHAATKQYVDNIATGLDFKASVAVATTDPITLSGVQTIDGYMVQVGDRVLVKNQSVAQDNGIYTASASAWARSSDADSNAEVTSGLFVYVENGVNNGATGWVLSTTGIIVLGTTALTFTQFNGLAGVTAGAGLQASGNTLSVKTADATNITVGVAGINLATIAGLTTGTTFNNFQVDAYGRITIAGSTAYITENQGFTVSGDISGTYSAGGTGLTLTLPTVNATGAGTYTKLSVNAKGLVTSAGSLSATDIPNLSWTKITSDLPTTLAGYGITDAQPLDSKLTSISNLSGASTGLIKLTNGTASLDSSAYLTDNQSITLSGDASGSGTTAITVTLASTGVGANTYGSGTQVGQFAVDAKGRITSASNVTITPAFSSITGTPTTLLGYGITDAQPLDSDLTAIAQLSGTSGYLKTDGAGVWSVSNPTTLSGYGITDAVNKGGDTMTGALTLSGDPTQALHAATKQYVDNSITGLDFKQSVRAASDGSDLSLSGLLTLDGVSLVVGDRVLVKDQAIASQNGIYVVQTGAWTRATDADNSPSGEVTTGMYCFIEQGTVNGNTGWILSTANPITLDTTALSFTQFTGLGEVIAGNGLTKTGSQLDVNTASSSRIVVNADNIDLATTAVTAGAYGSATQVGTFTVDSYGRLTLAGNATVTPEWSSITNTPTTIAGYGLTGVVQPYDADLSTIAALTGTAGLLHTDGAGGWTVDGNTYITGNQTITLSGDVTGSGTTSITTTLANTAVAAGSYGSATEVGTFTVDGKGRLTAAGNVTVTPAFSSITSKPTTISGYGITKLTAFSGTTLPAGTVGDMYYLTTLDGVNLPGLYYHDGTNWICVATTTAINDILTSPTLISTGSDFPSAPYVPTDGELFYLNADITATVNGVTGVITYVRGIYVYDIIAAAWIPATGTVDGGTF